MLVTTLRSVRQVFYKSQKYRIFFNTTISILCLTGPIRALGKVKKNLDIKKTTRYFVYIFVSAWKILAFFCAMLFSLWITGQNLSNLFSKFTEGFQEHRINITEVRYFGTKP